MLTWELLYMWRPLSRLMMVESHVTIRLVTPDYLEAVEDISFETLYVSFSLIIVLKESLTVC